MSNTLDKAHARVAAIRAEIADDAASERLMLQDIADEQAALAEIRQKHAAKRLDQKLADALRALGEAEENAIDIWRDALASDILRLQAENPLQHRAQITAKLQQLRAAAPNQFEWPINKPFVISPLVSQALGLLPPRDDLTTPVNELSGLGGDWPTRRRKILESNSSPLQAA